MPAFGKAPPINPPGCDSRPLWDAWLSVFHLPALTVADEIGVFALLAQGPGTAGFIAERSSISDQAGETLLNLLAAFGYLHKDGQLFSLTALSREYLLPSSPYYWGGVLHSVRDMPVSHAMILETVRRDGRGRNRFVKKFTDDWTSSDFDMEKARIFTAKMHSHGVAAARDLAEMPYFKGIERLLDVGGGSGCYSVALASTHPEMFCTVAELPTVCPVTQEYIDESKRADRIKVIPIDMFKEQWPRGYNAVFFSDIFHDWGKEQCLELAEKAFDSIVPGGRIFVHEALLRDNKVGPATINAYSMAMLMVTHGKQFTSTEMTEILESVGFIGIEVTPAHGYYSLIMGRKP